MADMTDTTATVGAPHPDATTVTAWLAGDRSALAVIYDRYGQSLYDTAAAMTGDRNDAADMVQDVFVLAAERLGQLRDPSRLKPWLFAILRNEVYRRSRRRSRTTSTDFGDPERDVMLPPTDDHTIAVDDQMAHDDLAELVRGAARGLDQRDQLVLELSVRQGLSGNDLADALGVSAQQSYGLVHRMRERTERSLGAFCVARRGRRDCDELSAILGDWDGEFSVLLRKRVARHIDDCSTCERSRKRYAPIALIGAAPAFAAPLELRDLIVSSTPVPAAGGGGAAGLDRSTGFPRLAASASRTIRTVAFLGLSTAAGFAAVIGGIGVLRNDDTPRVADGGTQVVVVDTPESADRPGEQRTEVVAPATETTTAPARVVDPTDPSTPTATAAPNNPAPPVIVVPSDGPNEPATSTVPATTVPATTVPATTVPATTAPATTTTAAPTTTIPDPAAIGVEVSTLNFGREVSALDLTVTNTGGTATTPTVAIVGPQSVFTVSTPRRVEPGETATLTVTFDRGVGNDLAPSATLSVSAGESTASIALIGEIPAPTMNYVGPCDFDDNDTLWPVYEVTYHESRGPLQIETNADVSPGGRWVQGSRDVSNGIVTERFEIGFFSYDAAEVTVTDRGGNGVEDAHGPMKLRGVCQG